MFTQKNSTDTFNLLLKPLFTNGFHGVKTSVEQSGHIGTRRIQRTVTLELSLKLNGSTPTRLITVVYETLSTVTSFLDNVRMKKVRRKTCRHFTIRSLTVCRHSLGNSPYGEQETWNTLQICDLLLTLNLSSAVNRVAIKTQQQFFCLGCCSAHQTVI